MSITIDYLESILHGLAAVEKRLEEQARFNEAAMEKVLAALNFRVSSYSEREAIHTIIEALKANIAELKDKPIEVQKE